MNNNLIKLIAEITIMKSLKNDVTAEKRDRLKNPKLYVVFF